MERKGTNILDWLIEMCHIDAVEAKHLEEQVKEKCSSTKVETLQAMLFETPELLDSIEAPVWIKQLLNKNLCSFNCIPLKSLSTTDVQSLFQLFYPDEHYGNKVRDHRVNGIVLCDVDDINKLESWGISNQCHGTFLLKNIQNWKSHGVPFNLLRGDSTHQHHVTPIPRDELIGKFILSM